MKHTTLLLTTALSALLLASCEKKPAPHSQPSAQADTPASAEVARPADKPQAPAVKVVSDYDTDDEKAVFKTVYNGMTTPVAINSFELYSEYVSITLCNISGETITEITFSYKVFDEDGKEVFVVSEKLAHEIAPFAACAVEIGNPEPVSGWNEDIQDIQIGIAFEGGKEAVLTGADVLSCMKDLSFCLYKDENLSISWEYHLEGGTYFMYFEARDWLDYSYFRFKTDEYVDDGMTLDFYEGTFFYDDSSFHRNGESFSETWRMPNYLEDIFTTTKSLEIEYLVSNPDNPGQRQLPEEEKRSLAKKVVIDDEVSLEQIRAFASFMDIMGLR